ncbi:hypothetical protein Q0590_11665 [Rhodocytophaga aerolata]|uniref:PH domain-containing protein n=1 Tax=Rhodocytophaga aerolata TaxID=455078 RepID=A0ABT8R489_9BACT|nr:hypothetical protein [Rhodocytophaga aerolata]MDO1446916.1 hypothetical protein [Rhodocytophaga aerolata]
MNAVPTYRRRTKPIAVNAYIPAVVMILAGVVLLTKFVFAGLLFIVIALFALTLTEGLEIDFTNQRIRIFSGFFGLRFGTWEPLPVMERITLVEVIQKHSLMSRTNLTTEIPVSYAQVRLYSQGSTEYYVASYGKLASSRADAHILSKHFGLRYEDYTVAHKQ